MGPRRYAAVNQHDHDDDDNNESPITPTSPERREIPQSPPPSFHSRNSSPSSRRLLNQDPLHSDAEDDRDRDLADAFDDSDNEDDSDDRQRLMRSNTSRSTSSQNEAAALPPVSAPPPVERRVTSIPSFAPTTTPRAAPKPASDGVFANLSAKPSAGEPIDDKPPTYAEAAADATPAYWETTIFAPGTAGDEVYVNGLPVGSVFSFIWNGMISMSFLFPGFLLTYLLHTTHAAKNGSLAGLGLTLVQYGFYNHASPSDGNANPGQFAGTPPDPNSHDFNPNNPGGDNAASGGGGEASSGSGFTSSDMISYGLMIVGWFILIRAVSSFLRARREEQLVLQSPGRGLNVPVVAEGEGERAV